MTPAAELPDLSTLAGANIAPEVMSALSGILAELETLKLRRSREVDPTSMFLVMMMAGARRTEPFGSDEEIIERSKDLIAAVDRSDEAAVAALLGPGFTYFHAGRTYDRDTLLARLSQRRSKVQHSVDRTWSEESVARRDDVLVFTARAHELHGGSDRHGGYVDDGTYLLQWVRTRDGWQVQLLTWQRGSTEREWYNDTFRKNRGFSLEPNRLLIDAVAEATPGAALDLAMGQGRNALYLASEGWTVTGVDISDEGLRVAHEQATERGLSIEAINADIDGWDFGQDRFDLVTMLYAGDHAKWIDKIKASLRADGLVVVEGWAREAPDSPFGFGESQLATLFEGYEILRDETVDGAPDWSWDEGKLVRFVARKR